LGNLLSFYLEFAHYSAICVLNYVHFIICGQLFAIYKDTPEGEQIGHFGVVGQGQEYKGDLPRMSPLGYPSRLLFFRALLQTAGKEIY